MSHQNFNITNHKLKKGQNGGFSWIFWKFKSKCCVITYITSHDHWPTRWLQLWLTSQFLSTLVADASTLIIPKLDTGCNPGLFPANSFPTVLFNNTIPHPQSCRQLENWQLSRTFTHQNSSCISDHPHATICPTSYISLS